VDGREFFNEIVLPTVEEFSCNPGDIRRGVLACLVLYSLADHYFHANSSDPQRVNLCTSAGNFRKSLRQSNWAFNQIALIANGTKHVGKEFRDLHLAAPNRCDIMRVGFPLSDEPYVFADDDNAWILHQLTDYVANEWKTMLGLVP